jgi:hypothetical protein
MLQCKKWHAKQWIDTRCPNRRCINTQRSAGGELVPPIGFETPGFETPGFETPKLQERRSRKNVAVAIMQAGMPADEAPMVGATVSITQI